MLFLVITLKTDLFNYCHEPHCCRYYLFVLQANLSMFVGNLKLIQHEKWLSVYSHSQLVLVTQKQFRMK